jgi:hypothetical protein
MTILIKITEKVSQANAYIMPTALLPLTHQSCRKACQELCTRKRSVLKFTFAVFVIGYVFLGLSVIDISQSSPSLKEIGISALPDKTRLTIYLPEKGTYYLNSTSEIQTNESSIIEVFDSKERLVFGLPVLSLPSDFAIDSAGYYSISLEKVTMQGARLEVVEYAQNVTLFAPYWYLSTPSKVMLVFGGILSGVVFVFYIATRSDEQKGQSREFRKIVEISPSLRVISGSISILLGPLAFYVILAFIFGPLPNLLLVESFIVVSPIMAVYCLEFYDIVGIFLSVFGYEALLSMRRILVYLMVSVVITYVPVYVASVWTNMALGYNGAVIFLLFSIPLSALLTLLAPFIDPLTYVGEARLALQEFLSAFRQGSGNADFRYIREASKRLPLAIGRNCSQVSSQGIERHITSDLFAQARTRSTEISDSLIQRILLALNPFNSAALIEIIGGTIDEEDRRARPRFDATLALLTLLVSILGVIAYFLK